LSKDDLFNLQKQVIDALDPVKFLDWLRSKDDGVVVGEVRSASHCILACYLQDTLHRDIEVCHFHTQIISEGLVYTLTSALDREHPGALPHPQWCSAFSRAGDKDTLTGTQYTAAAAIAVFAQVFNYQKETV